MFKFKGLNKKINRIHEKSLTLVLNDHQSTLDKILDTLNEKTIHQQYIDRLLIEVYKFLNGIPLILWYSPDIMNDVFLSEAKYLQPPKLPCFCYGCT